VVVVAFLLSGIFTRKRSDRHLRGHCLGKGIAAHTGSTA
jgi:hypothetical protein